MPNIVKNTSIVGPLDLFAPHSCRGCGHLGNALCDRCKKYIISIVPNICPNCKEKTIDGKCKKCVDLPRIFVIGKRQELIGKIVQDYKYSSIRALALPLAEIIDKVITKPSSKIIIVPLPTIQKHVRERGLDHTYLIAKYLAKLRGKNHSVQKLLKRAKNTVQVGANKRTRQKQAKEAYYINSKATIDPEATYLLLDDIWTTGASIKSATKKLHQAGAKNIEIVILAVS